MLKWCIQSATITHPFPELRPPWAFMSLDPSRSFWPKQVIFFFCCCPSFRGSRLSIYQILSSDPATAIRPLLTFCLFHRGYSESIHPGLDRDKCRIPESILVRICQDERWLLSTDVGICQRVMVSLPAKWWAVSPIKLRSNVCELGCLAFILSSRFGRVINESRLSWVLTIAHDSSERFPLP